MSQDAESLTLCVTKQWKVLQLFWWDGVRWYSGEIRNDNFLLDVSQLIITLHKWPPWHPHRLWTALTQGWSIANLSGMRQSWERCLHLRCLIRPTGASMSCLYHLYLGTLSHHSMLLFLIFIISSSRLVVTSPFFHSHSSSSSSSLPQSACLWYSLPSTHASPPGAPVTQLGFHL